MKNVRSRYKAVGLLSGGLDSAIAVKLIQAQGIEVHGVYIAMPWGCGCEPAAAAVARELGIPLNIMSLGDDYLSILKSPRYGFGSAHNPCVDCHIYMIRKAADHMRAIDAAFVFTGEVLGQRPMSQRKPCLEWVDQDSGIPGYLLRPLSAQRLPPTIPEQEGIVDRAKLLGISGRSRKEQYALAKHFGISCFSAPGGGCLLTEPVFSARIKDVLARGCDNIGATAVLGMGRYFRVNDKFFIILGRDEKENENLIRYALPDDMIVRPFVFPGPVALVRGADPDDQAVLSLAAGLAQFYSKSRGKGPLPLSCWQSKSPDITGEVRSTPLSEADIVKMAV